MKTPVGKITGARVLHHSLAMCWHVIMTFWAICWSIPSRFVANIMHLLYAIPVPTILRQLLYRLWAWRYGARLEEAERPPEEYKSHAELFMRKLQRGLRRLSNAAFVSPIDGSIISHGVLLKTPADEGDQKVEEREAEEAEFGGPMGADFEIQEAKPQRDDPRVEWTRGPRARNNFTWVKGIPYRVQDLFGVAPPDAVPGNELHLLTMFLPASEYHHFHCPVDWTVTHRIRIPGQVLPLLPEKTRWFPQMLWSNERVVLLGTWAHGVFWMAFIAATALVGRIRLDAEPELITNEPTGLLESLPYLTGWRPPHARTRRDINAFGLHRVGAVPVGGEKGSTPQSGLNVRAYEPPLHFQRGQHIGHFEVGSGMAILCEAPKDQQGGSSTSSSTSAPSASASASAGDGGAEASFFNREAVTPGYSFKLGEAMTAQTAPQAGATRAAGARASAAASSASGASGASRLRASASDKEGAHGSRHDRDDGSAEPPSPFAGSRSSGAGREPSGATSRSAATQRKAE